MSVYGDTISTSGLDSSDQQPAFVFTRSEDAIERPAKRRKVSKANSIEYAPAFKFEPLFGGSEDLQWVKLRQELFVRFWKETEGRIQSVLQAANEETLAKVTAFVQNTNVTKGMGTLPAGFIATGPNIASQSLLFEQLSDKLRAELQGPVVTLRSGDASNLKAMLKQIIRETTNQKSIGDDENGFDQRPGRKLLNYDLELLHRFVNAHESQKVVVAFQDSEAFDPGLLVDIITLFNCWEDRIPFILLFGIATSVDLFHERLSRAASRYLSGTQFDVEQTSSILESLFQKVTASTNVPVRLGPGFISSLMERQHDHVQSVQAFTSALKYAYMFHFYSNPLAVLSNFTELSRMMNSLTPLHLEAVRKLSSFQELVKLLFDNNDKIHAKKLLEDDDVLREEIELSLKSTSVKLTHLSRKMQVIASIAKGPVGKVELYLKAFKGTLNDSDIILGLFDNIKRMSPQELASLIDTIEAVAQNGSLELGLDGWLNEEPDFALEIGEVRKQVALLAATGNPVRSSYAAHSKAVRTTVIAQKVQLSYEKSSLSREDIEYTKLIDQFLETLRGYLTCENPQQWFLNEVWLFDFTFPYKDVFAPRPRHVLENALFEPSGYLLSCDPSVEVLSSASVPTAIIYHMYLESGSLINISDLWTSFFSIMEGEGDEGCDERTALMLFYKGLADLKLLGMIKQSKRKVDHLGKSLWRGL
ncbi:origin recognition complex subunit 3 N-terminus-domain-containing protein [Bisporella sp. PMI_857]|nr:origin recognition complex subunit 3 N-terminus-domain-containing protein [Bisporella sp. PMI_857]